jgi:SOS-response transcriptional repressor LexA
MQKLAGNLIALLKTADISESELARQTGVDQSIIHRLASGENVNPKLATLIPIAKHFAISLDQLIGLQPINQDQLPEKTKIKNIRFLPLLNLDQIDNWLEQKLDITNLAFLPIDLAANELCYAIEIQDSILEPRFISGTYFLVDPKLNPENKDFVVFRKLDNPKASIRQIFFDNAEKYLKALNPDFGTILLNQDYKLLGTVIQTVTQRKNSISTDLKITQTKNLPTNEQNAK